MAKILYFPVAGESQGRPPARLAAAGRRVPPGHGPQGHRGFLAPFLNGFSFHNLQTPIPETMKPPPQKRLFRTARALAMFALAFALLLAATTDAAAQFRNRGKGTIKAGLNRVFVSGATYTLADNAGTPSFSNADAMEGNEVFLEFLFFGRMGVELGVGLTEMTRTYSLGGAAEAVDLNVEETARPTVVGLNIYSGDHSSGGVKYFFGLGTGQVAVSHTYSGTGITAAASSVTVPINTLKIGLDWITENAGVRLQFISQSGEKTDTETHSGDAYTQTVSYAASVFAVGVFSFF